jgi:predicted DsbA family dithiol-disulfide isomerase
MRVVVASYYTDPCCPWSWALEPALRKLVSEFGSGFSLTYVMCGMAQEFGDALPLVEEMLAASAASGMPVDARLWLDDPPRSSHPACIAVKAAAEQGDPAPYLRRLREGVMCRRRRLDGPAALVDVAREAGLDVERFRLDLSSHGTLEAFAADLDRAKSVPAEHFAAGSDRAKLPSLEFRSADGGAVHGVYGPSAYDELRKAAVAAGVSPVDADGRPGVLDALQRFGTMSTAEVASVCDLPGPRAPAELWRLAAEWRVKQERLGSGELWSVA